VGRGVGRDFIKYLSEAKTYTYIKLMAVLSDKQAQASVID
jgi:hypothetical protein